MDGYSFAESTLALNGNSFRLWVYAPLNDSPGRSCVIVPPAGSPMFLGINLSEGDQPEQLPYVKGGHYVVSFDILGAKPANATNADVGRAIKQFFEAGAGVDQVPLIIAFIKDHLKSVDPKAIYMAGHSSAGTLLLESSQRVDGLAGAIAYFPIVDFETRIAVKNTDGHQRTGPSLQRRALVAQPRSRVQADQVQIISLRKQWRHQCAACRHRSIRSETSGSEAGCRPDQRQRRSLQVDDRSRHSGSAKVAVALTG